MKKSTHPLSAEELRTIEVEGLNPKSIGDWVREGANGKIAFTVKGIATLQFANEYFGLNEDFLQFESMKDLNWFLYRLQSKTVRVLHTKLRKSRDLGSVVPAHRAVVDAMLGGTLDDITKAVERTATLAESGPHVILLPLKRKRSA